jgi:toxin ParE1/3/4
MAKPYRLSPLAERDLEDIWRYTAKHWSLAQADSYHRALMETVEALANGSKQGRPAGVLPGIRKCLCGSHVVFFFDEAQHLDVVRVLHQSQDAERHL